MTTFKIKKIDDKNWEIWEGQKEWFDLLYQIKVPSEIVVAIFIFLLL